MAFWFLERGADLNKSPAPTDITPLSFAVKNAAPDLLRDLLDHSGDVQKGEVLQYALDRETDAVPVLGMLLDRGAPIDAVMYEEHLGSMSLYFFIPRNTPLCKAAAIGNAEAVRFLLERGADPTVRNSWGETPVDCAEQRGRREVFEILTQWGPRSSDAKKHLPKTPILLQGKEVWVKTENLVDNGTHVMIGGFKCPVDPPSRPVDPPSGGGVASEQAPQEPPGETPGPRAGVEVAGTTGDGRVAEWVEQTKEAAPTEDSWVSGDPAKSPGCLDWKARLRRWRRRRMRRKGRLFIDD